MRLRRAGAGLAVVLLTAGCGLGEPEPGTLTPAAALPLPRPTPGTVEIAGVGDAWLDGAVLRADRGRPGLGIDLTPLGADRAFARLCAGGIDVVHSTRPISAGELAGCAAHGLDVVQLLLAADADVVAVEATAEPVESCVTVAQVQSGLGGTGEGRLRERVAHVAGFQPDRNLVARLPEIEPRYAALKREVEAAWAVWGAATSARDRAAARAEVERIRVRLRPVERVHRAARAARRRLHALAGHLGRFTPVEVAAHPDELRPLAVRTDDGDCVVPSTRTVLDGSYPLARPMLLTLTTRAWARPVVQGFLTAVLGHAELLATRSGTVPVGEALLDRQLSWLGTGGPPDSAVLTTAELPAPPTPEVPVR